MKTIVVCVGAEDRRFADAFLPATRCIAEGGGRIYRLYYSDVAAGYAVKDLDGTTLIEVKVFNDLDAAKEWLAADVRRHELLLSARGRAS